MFGFFKRRRATGSDAGELKKSRDIERGPTGVLAFLVVILVIGGFVGAKALFSPSSFRGHSAAAAVPERPTLLPTAVVVVPTQTPWVIREEIVVTATPSPTPVPTATPWIIREMVTVPITKTIQGPPVVQWREKIVEKKITVPVTVTVPLPAPTVVPLGSGMIELCWRVEGVKEVWIDGDGVGGSGCRTYQAAHGENLRGIRVVR